MMKLKDHLTRHGQGYMQHLASNFKLTLLSLKAAYYTLGHGLFIGISGRKASELHTQIWCLSRGLALQDLEYRLDNNIHKTRSAACDDFNEYRDLYPEDFLIKDFVQKIDEHFQKKS